MMRISPLMSAAFGTALCLPVLAAEPTVADLQRALEEQRRQLEATADSLEQLRGEVETADSGTRKGLGWAGYGVINYSEYDFYRNVQDDDPERRAKVDVERFVLMPHYDFGDGWRFEGEIEFEHGGTGSSVEYESEEFGEYEMEVEKGGEIVLETAALVYEHSPVLNWRLGHIVVPVGMVNTHHQPTQYFTTTRSLAETALIPSVWHETGAELFGTVGRLRYSALLVNGLDSSGFSSSEWIRGGHQSRMEFANADNLAGVLRLDYDLALGVSLGGSYYYGDSADNRHQQNLAVEAPVTIAELHGRYERGPFTARGQVMRGTVENSDAVTLANRNSVNQGIRGISATPVGHAAEAAFIEAGYDIFSLFSAGEYGRLDLFGRYDRYDTMAEVEGTIQDNPRFEVTASTVGLNYHPRPGLVFKGEYRQQEHAGTVGTDSNTIAFGLGFEF